ncbi:hypothetical protein E2C01_058212 [Portunus trituberculatus]|uniref:Uncharacterized protein n=1 Tax=Portunus trituberculatus TaxID=210409 RepID=A0A5B7GV00_PORTR|nr:hypothetical protein [Portunus trituberculatus]
MKVRPQSGVTWSSLCSLCGNKLPLHLMTRVRRAAKQIYEEEDDQGNEDEDVDEDDQENKV